MNQNESSYNELAKGLLIVPKALLDSLLENQNKILSLLKINKGKSANSELPGKYIPEIEAKRLLGRQTTWFWNMRTRGNRLCHNIINKFNSNIQLFNIQFHNSRT